jgi:membrane-bound lytic murein transglycosylase A
MNGRKIRQGALTAAVGLLATACASSPERTGPEIPTTARPSGAFNLAAARFSDLPDWQRVDLRPALTAFRSQCANWRARPGGRVDGSAKYGGDIAMWSAACAAADAASPGGERAFFEANFVPYSISSNGAPGRLTGYYEPTIRVSRTPSPDYSEPLLRKPSDLVTVDLAAFAEAYDNDVLRGAPRALNGKMYGDRVRPYPSRAEILSAPPSQAFAYAHPSDLYNLQVQGSGRIEFPDGQTMRAAFAAQNGYRWRSALGAAKDSGRISEATWESFRSYLDGLNPGGARAALNEDPSYVFFNEEPIANPNAGPRGAANVALTPMGSIAVDPAFHPYGALLFVDGTYDGEAFRRLLVAQDTGGAIRRGPLRGDVFFGSGPAAGAQAERLNSENVRFWTLIPRGVPIA